jgi:hypothetical protein
MRVYVRELQEELRGNTDLTQRASANVKCPSCGSGKIASQLTIFTPQDVEEELTTNAMKRDSRHPPPKVVDIALEKATYGPGDYGRIVRADGSQCWWVRSPKGTWIALNHERVMENDDRSITLLVLQR